ncbi:subtilisin-like protease 4 [Lolium rigidum]|uniref:subtilisin-like protease 4 n=1 Tax=Lolium rigidum TaxID=89674 RepID=UPI001F5DF303|nr:subtilisin-like protease 4 [Lolium rigidum]
MASSMALLLLLLLAVSVTSTTAEVDERELHIELASTIAELVKAAVTKFGDCPEAAVLRASDEAVADGVHGISLSLTVSYIPTYDQSSISTGGFYAMQQGIHVVVCAGNRGPAASSILNAEL